MTTGQEAITTSVASDGGDLFKLPQEIRDEIYRYVLKPKYALHATTGCDDHDADLTAILRVSKQISYETKSVLYAESIFTCRLDLIQTISRTQRAKEVTDRIMHVEYHISNIGELFHWHLGGVTSSRMEELAKLCEDIIGTFSGTDITRRHLKIAFVDPLLLEMNIPRLFSVVFERLGGFRTIRFELHWPSDISSKRYSRLAVRVTTKCMNALDAQLKSALGPADHEYWGTPDIFGYHGSVTFHPHEHLIKNPDLEVKQTKNPHEHLIKNPDLEVKQTKRM